MQIIDIVRQCRKKTRKDYRLNCEHKKGNRQNLCFFINEIKIRIPDKIEQIKYPPIRIEDMK